MFSLEMILKITAFGSFSYLRNPYNVFDGVIVIIRYRSVVRFALCRMTLLLAVGGALGSTPSVNTVLPVLMLL